MEISNQEDIKEQEELDRQLLDLGRTVPLPEPEVPQPACPLPVRRWSLELGELCWGRSQIMTGECSPVSLHNYLLIWNTAKWMFYVLYSLYWTCLCVGGWGCLHVLHGTPPPEQHWGEMLITNIIHFSPLAFQFYIFRDKAIEWPKFIFQLWCKTKEIYFWLISTKITKLIFSIHGREGGG